LRCFRIPGFAEECLALEVAVELVGKFNTDVGEDALGLSHCGSRSSRFVIWHDEFMADY
jgi:hypothetical protein